MSIEKDIAELEKLRDLLYATERKIRDKEREISKQYGPNWRRQTVISSDKFPPI